MFGSQFLDASPNNNKLCSAVPAVCAPARPAQTREGALHILGVYRATVSVASRCVGRRGRSGPVAPPAMSALSLHFTEALSADKRARFGEVEFETKFLRL